jgi:t-SNARE complex subunit (syntaxin)
MSDQKQAPDKDDNLLEGQAQVDPLLFEGPAKPWRIWAVAIVITCIVVVVLYGLA